jgi:transcription initiation factor TFIID subunit 13
LLEVPFSSMSYSYPPPPQPGQPPTTTYAYGAYHPPPGVYGQPHTQAPGASPYPTAYSTHGYPTGVTGYGTWSGYAYNFAPGQRPLLQPLAGNVSRPPIQTAGVPTATSTSAAALTPRLTTFSSYSPSYPKESAAAASSGGTSGRGTRKQVNHKGLFAKECEFVTVRGLCY